ncbi:hypothetical protein CEXT_530181 [Caerostris extrusa]|uniref:Uncharacterized protein n=1 Tax=Caerostris extrusa TaxID=172846 RepID=A0AAV4XA36_CAEEX|nr:hypothetical protein CEXT_530181 [Caerostris extrusa]
MAFALLKLLSTETPKAQQIPCVVPAPINPSANSLKHQRLNNTVCDASSHQPINQLIGLAAVLAVRTFTHGVCPAKSYFHRNIKGSTNTVFGASSHQPIDQLIGLAAELAVRVRVVNQITRDGSFEYHLAPLSALGAQIQWPLKQARCRNLWKELLNEIYPLIRV